MSYSLGVDLGTTFVAAAIARPTQIEMFTLGDRSVVTPAVVYLREDGAVVTGEAANRRSVSNPDRVGREFKRRMGDPTPVMLAGAPHAVTDLLAAVLRDVLTRVTQTEGERPERVVLTHPANWGPFRRGLFEQVPVLAGLEDAHLITEPEAAAAHYAASRDLGEGEVVAVYDLGGGTFDATVLRNHADGVEILGEPEGIERLGGVDFDEAILNYVNYTSGGALSELDLRDPQTGIAMARLRQDCVLAKETLSIDNETILPVFLPGRHFDVSITRAEFEDLVRAPVESTIGALSRTLRSAGVSPDELSAVLLVGGSSRIPLVGRMVSEELGRPTVVDTHPKYAVALGAATLARTAARAPQPAATATAVAELARNGQGGTNGQNGRSGRAPGTEAAAAVTGVLTHPDPPVANQPAVPHRPTETDRAAGADRAAVPKVPSGPEQPDNSAGADRSERSGPPTGPDRSAANDSPVRPANRVTSLPGVPLTARPGPAPAGSGPAGSGTAGSGTSGSGTAAGTPTPPTSDPSRGGTPRPPGPAAPSAAGQAWSPDASEPSGARGAWSPDASEPSAARGAWSPDARPASTQGDRWAAVRTGPPADLAGARPPRGGLSWVALGVGSAAVLVIGVVLAFALHWFGLPSLGGGTDAAGGSAPNTAAAAPAEPVDPKASLPVPSLGAAIPVGATPGFAAVSPNGRQVYIANRGAKIVTVVDTSVNQVTATIPVDAGPPQFLTFAPDGKRVYVSIFNPERTIAAIGVLDTTTNKIVATIPVRTRPFVAAVTKDGKYLCVPNHDSGTLSVIDTEALAVVKEIKVAPNPHWVEFSPDGSRAYTANHESNLISVLDVATDAILAEVPVGTSPHSVAVNPERPLVANVNYDGASVTFIDTNTNQVTATVPVGQNPQEISWSPDGRHAYVANVGDGTVSVVSADEARVTATIPTGRSPTSVAVLPDGATAYVTNLDSGTLTVLNIGG
ncbi:MAG: Hsp70 family protein [Pseudonocardia sp.]